FLRELSRRQRNRGYRQIRSRPDAPDEPSDTWSWRCNKHCAKSSRLGERSARGQAGLPDAQHEINRQPTGSGSRIPGIAELRKAAMASIDYPLDRPKVRDSEFSFSEVFYHWVATVDHKRLGLMYIVSALLFL